jgi:hypothetical protein
VVTLIGWLGTLSPAIQYPELVQSLSHVQILAHTFIITNHFSVDGGTQLGFAPLPWGSP